MHNPHKTTPKNLGAECMGSGLWISNEKWVKSIEWRGGVLSWDYSDCKLHVRGEYFDGAMQ